MPQQKKSQQGRAPRTPSVKQSPFSIRRPATVKEARKWLQRVAAHLSSYENAGPPLLFVADAINQYLQDPETRSLVHELGLVNPPGNPGNFQSRMNERVRGRTIVQLKHAGKPLVHICDAVGLQNKQSVKNLYKKYSALFLKEESQDRIDKDLKEFLKVPIR